MKTYGRRTRLMSDEEQVLMDKLFLTEILNDLGRRGQADGGWKADQMLRDWAKELRAKCRTIYPASRLKKTHRAIVGPDCW